LGIEDIAMESVLFWVMHMGKKLSTVYMAVGWNLYINWKGFVLGMRCNADFVHKLGISSSTEENQ
jgi:uncharacterized membrane protein YwaF